MFKRVEKRRLKKEEEEKLGLDEDMKEILGMHDTDSEESASDNDDSESEEDDEDGEDNDVTDQENGLFDAEDESGAEESEDDDAADAEDPDVSVAQALEDPIYVVSVLPEVKACIICPGKLLKAAKMVQLHRISNAHERRLKQFKALAADAEPSESAWEVLQRGAEEKPKLSLVPSEGATSKRAEKKKAQAAKLKLRREKAKAKRAKDALKKKITAPTSKTEQTTNKKASKADSVPSSQKGKVVTKPATSSPPKKKRKMAETTMDNDAQPKLANKEALLKPKKAKKSKPQDEGKGVPAVLSNPPSSKDRHTTETKEAVKDVARSISDRAKSARQRAVSNLEGGKDELKPRRKKAKLL